MPENSNLLLIVVLLYIASVIYGDCPAAPPVLLAASNAHVSVPVNTDITLTIDVSAKPAPIAIWQLNSEDLPSMTTPSMNILVGTACPKTYQAVLTVTGFTNGHSGTYTVIIINRLGHFTHSFQRMLGVPATVSNLTGTNNNCIIRGQDSMLTCTYGGVPQPSVLWYTLTGDIRTNIPVNNAEYIVESTLMETVLIIRIVDDADDVIYGCEATNTVNGTVVIEKIELDIDICSMPVFTTPLESKIEVNVMEDVIFYCNGKGEPEITYEWFHTNSSGQRVYLVGDMHIRLGVEVDTGVNYLVIIGVTQNDQGSYTCQITTPIGTLESTGILKVYDTKGNNTPTTQNESTLENDSVSSTVIIVIFTVLCTIILILLVIISICFYQRFHSANANADADSEVNVSERINRPSYETVLNKKTVSNHLQGNSSHAVNTSNADTETYDDVISEEINHPIYEAIPNEDCEVAVSINLQDNLSHAANERKDINTVAEVKSTKLQSCGRKHAIRTTNPDPTYDTATRKHIVMTTNAESVAVRPNPAYGAVHGVKTTVTQESLV